MAELDVEISRILARMPGPDAPLEARERMLPRVVHELAGLMRERDVDLVQGVLDALDPDDAVELLTVALTELAQQLGGRDIERQMLGNVPARVAAAWDEGWTARDRVPLVTGNPYRERRADG